MKKILFVIPLATLTIACGAGDAMEEAMKEVADANDAILQEEVPVPVDPIVDDSIASGEVVDRQPAYDFDFERFKDAVKNKDIRGISAFASSDAVDAEEVLGFFNDEDFYNKLMEMTYADLYEQDNDGMVQLVCSVNVSGEFEGEIYESAVVLYFSKGETSLMLDTYMVAG